MFGDVARVASLVRGLCWIETFDSHAFKPRHSSTPTPTMQRIELL